MGTGAVCRSCRQAARREKTIWSTNRPPVHVYLCDACRHTFLVHDRRLDLTSLIVRLPTASAT